MLTWGVILEIHKMNGMKMQYLDAWTIIIKWDYLY